MARFRLIPITPRRPLFNLKSFDVAKARLLSDIGTKIARDLERPTRSWSAPAKFVKIQTRNEVQVATENRKYIYLNNGTNVRYALMSKGFSPKTRPGALTSRAGRGGAVLTGRRAFAYYNLRPRPGIQPRSWDKLVSAKYGPELAERFRAALLRYILTGKT